MIINLTQYLARRDCIFIIALSWGHVYVNAPVEFVVLKCSDTHRQDAASVAIAMHKHPCPWDI